MIAPEIISYTTALGVGLLWGVVPIFMITLVRQHGALVCNTVRIYLATALFAALSLVWGNWSSITFESGIAALQSGIIGLLFGDFLLYYGLKYLGPRRNSLLFASNTVFGILLGVWLLNESYPLVVWLGIAVMLLGIQLAILFAPSRSGRTRGPGSLVGDDDVVGEIRLGVLAVLAAALCHSYGLFVLKPHLSNGQDPLMMNTLRLLVAAVFSLPVVLRISWSSVPATDILKIAFFGSLAIGLGSFLLQFAMIDGELGMVSLLSATSPFWILPLLWWRTGECPHYNAWLGAVLGVLGLGCILVITSG